MDENAVYLPESMLHDAVVMFIKICNWRGDFIKCTKRQQEKKAKTQTKRSTKARANNQTQKAVITEGKTVATTTTSGLEHHGSTIRMASWKRTGDQVSSVINRSRMLLVSFTHTVVRAHCQGGRMFAPSRIDLVSGGGDIEGAGCHEAGGVLKELGGAGGGIGGIGSSSYSCGR